MTEQHGVLANLRERFADLIDGGGRRRQLEEITASVRHMWGAYLDGPYHLQPDELLRQLGEYDSAYLYDLVNQLEYEQIGSLTSYREGDAGREWQFAVKESRRLWRYSVLYQWAVSLWTSYGFGEGLEVVPDDKKARPPEEKEAGERLGEQGRCTYRDRVTELGVWQEFWSADRNARLLGEASIYGLSEDVLRDGNVILAYYASTSDGETTVAELDVDEVKSIVSHPENKWQPLFYKREFSLGANAQVWYYPDWQAYFSGALDEPYKDGKTLAEYVGVADGQRTDKMRLNGDQPGTVAVAQHIAYNEKDRASLWGWPLSTTGAAWDRAHKQYMQNRLSVSAAKAMYVRRLRVAGGSRNVKSVAEQIASKLSATNYQETNPAAAAGSTFLHNRATDFEDLPMRTGADDAKVDQEMFSWMPILAYGLFPHYCGQGDAYRLATATSMEKPLAFQFSRYRKFWSSHFRVMLKIVLKFAEKHGGARFVTYNGQVSMDRLVQADLEALSGAIGTFYRDFLVNMNAMGEIPQEVMDAVNIHMLQTVLQAVGADEVMDIISPEAFKLARAEKEEEPDDLEQPDTTSPPEDEEFPTELDESHVPQVIDRTCPFCGGPSAEFYEGHGNWVRCVQCGKTYDRILE